MIRALVFDLDGTLIDSRRDLAAAVNRLRGELGLDRLELPQVVAMVGEGARKLVERALRRPDGSLVTGERRTGERRTAHEAAAERFEAAFERFVALYSEGCLEATQPYPGIPATLEALAERYPLAVLTNKPEAMSRKILAGFGLDHHFQFLLGGDSLPTRKPDPAGLQLLAERLGTDPQHTLMVGDSAIDAATAAAAGSPFALVEWGFPPEDEIRDLQADLRLTSGVELIDLLAGW